jgi:DNA-binding NtrC family response regulator
MRDSQSGEASSVTKAAVLIVDDEEGVRSVLSQMLVLMGHRPTVCDGVSAANSELDAQRWDAAFFDILLRDGDGLQLLQQAMQVQPDLPVVMMSGAASPERLETARDAGASGFLLKPFTAGEVRRELNQALLRGKLCRHKRLLQSALDRVEQSQAEPRAK